MNKPKVILINGFAGSGKTTLAKMYVDNHPLSMVLEGDELIVNIGNWVDHEDAARKMVFELTKSIIVTMLKMGRDIIIPYLVTNSDDINKIEKIVRKHNADFFEFYLATNKKHAIQRLLNRGTWGEAGLPPISKDDDAIIYKLYQDMEVALQHRNNAIHIKIREGYLFEAYRNILKYIS
jgi:predicted kinase